VYLLVKVTGELYFAAQNLLVDHHGVLVVKGVNAGQHLVGEDAEGPPVDGFAVALVEKHLGREVLRGATKSVGAGLAVFGEAEVGQFQISILINQNVFRLEVAVDDVLRLKILEHKTDLGGVKPAQFSYAYYQRLT
jgi:hypothetical protein